MPKLKQLITENGAVARELLNSNLDENFEYDVIVIGSGMGGGVVASALADEKKQVLVLEAGSLLFPTHVGNLPRRLMIGKFQKHIWSLWSDFSVENYVSTNGVYQGGQGFNLGGRSIFWGSSIPPLSQWELDVWPKEIQDYLLDQSDKGGYALAKGVFNSDVPRLDAFHQTATTGLSQLLGAGWIVEPAPVAVEYTGATEWSIPSGIFSTADLLLEDAMAIGLQGREPLTVNLNHAAWSINFDPQNQYRATGVRCYDMLRNVERNYRAKAVVLSAGTLESAKIALSSGIANEKIGTGIVDHPIFYRHFVIPPQSLERLGLKKPVDVTTTEKPRFEPQSTKILIRHNSATMTNWAFDIVLELGAQFNQGRMVDHDHILEDLQARQDYLLCEIVFQFYAPLMENNKVTLQPGGGTGAPVNVEMERYQLDQALLNEAQGIANKIFQHFAAEQVYDEQNTNWPYLQEAAVGGVAHEVGTLRMPSGGQKGVVDENLRFEGYENLYACDNSVFPCSPAGNPSLTLVALARRCARFIAQSLP